MTSGQALSGSSLLAGRAVRRRRTGGGGAVTAAGGAATTLGVAIAAAGFTLLARRLAGGFTGGPAAGVPWAVVAGGIPLLLAVELAARLAGDRRPCWLARGGLVAAAGAVAPWGTPPAWPTQAAGLAGTVVTLIAALWPPAGWRPPTLSGRGGIGRGGRPTTAPAGDDGGQADRARSSSPAPRPTEEAAPQPRTADWPAVLPAGFRQRLERYETPAGADCIRGQVMLSVAAGSRTGHAHVGFCPAFATLPTVEVTTDCDFIEAEVAAAEILPWGVRVECRLSEPAEEPLEIPVALRAVRPAS